MQISILTIFIIFHILSSLVSPSYSNSTPTLSIITLNHTQIAITQKYQSTYKLLIPSNTTHIKIKTIPSNPTSHITFYLSETSSSSFFSKAESIGSNILILSSAFPPHLYITINSTKETEEYQLICTQLTEHNIEEGEEVSFAMEIDKQYEYVYRPSNTSEEEEVFIYAIVGNIEDVTIEGVITDDKVEIVKRFSQRFRNGYGLHIGFLNEKEIVDRENTKVVIRFISDFGGEILLGVKSIKRESDNDLRVYRETIGYVNSVDSGDCYKIKHKDIFPLEDSNERRVIMNIKTYPLNANLRLFDDNGNAVMKYQLEMIDAIQLDLNEKITMLCIEKTSIVPADIPYLTYSFQLIPFNEIESMQLFYTPIINNVQSKYILPPGQAIGLQRKRMNPYLTKEVELNLYSTQGNPLLYGHHCLSNACSYTITTIAELDKKKQITKANPINNHFHLFLSESELEAGRKAMMVVSCPGIVTCVFYASIFEEGDAIELLYKIPFYQLATLLTHKVFYYRVEDGMIASVSFVLQLITGDAKMTIEKREELIGEEILVANKNMITFSKKTIDGNDDESNDLKGDYFIVVTCDDHSYFSILVMIYKDNEQPRNLPMMIPTGETILQWISKEDPDKTFQIQKQSNNANDQQSHLILTINPLNCVVKYSTIQQENSEIEAIELDKHQQLIIKDNTSSQRDKDHYAFQVSFLRNKVNILNESNHCMIYMSAIESNNNDQLILLNEGIEHLVTVSLDADNNNNNEPKSFIYPFAYDITFNQAIIINIDYDNITVPLKVTVSFKGNDHSDPYITTIHKSRQLVYYSEFKHVCQVDMLCIVHISIEPKQLSAIPYDYLITIESLRKVPSYLTPNEYHKDIVIDDHCQYYYTEIGKDEEGKVMVVFGKGNGNVYARIVMKSLRESEADWNDHLILPSKATMEQGVNLRYDYVNRKISYDRKDTMNCGDGCELFITVQAEEYSMQKASLVTEYSIMASKHDGIINMNINDYYYGTLDRNDNNRQRYTYSFICPYETNELRIHVLSNDINVYINQGTFVTETNYEWLITTSTDVFSLRKTDEVPQFNHLQLVLLISLKSNSLQGSFSIKISISPPSIQEPITHIANPQGELCLFKLNYPQCHFIQAITSHSQPTHIYMLIESIDNPRNAFTIYVNILPSEVYETKFSNGDLPNKIRHDFTSEGYLNRHFLLFDNQMTGKMTGNYYVIVTVVGSMKGKGRFMMSTYANVGRMRLDYNEIRMMKKEKNSKGVYEIKGGERYRIVVDVIEGKGRIVLEESKRSVSLETTTIVETNEETFILEALSDALVYTVRYYAIDPIEEEKPKEMIEINYGNDNKIIPLHASYDNTYYFKLFPNMIDHKGSTIIITVRYSLYQITNRLTDNEDFHLSASLSNTLTPSSKIIKGQYDPISHFGIITLQAASMQLSDSFILISLNRTSSNTNQYLHLQPQITPYPINLITNNQHSLPQGKYYHYPIETSRTKTILKLSKSSKKDNKIIIEFSSCPGPSMLSYAIHDYTKVTREMTDRDLFKSDPSIIVSSKAKYHKTFIEIDMVTPEVLDHIALVVFRKRIDTMDIAMAYVVKYRSGVDIQYESGYTIDGEMGVKFNQTMKRIDVDWRSVVDIEEQVKQAEYAIEIEIGKEGSEGKEENTVCVYDDGNEGRRYRRRVGNEEMEKVVKARVDRFDYEEYRNYTIGVVALIVTKEDEEIRLGYKLGRFSTEGDPAPQINWVFYGSIIAIGAVIIILFIGFFLYLLCKKFPSIRDEIEESFQHSGTLPLNGENSLLTN